jgi:hypothetical protein
MLEDAGLPRQPPDRGLETNSAPTRFTTGRVVRAIDYTDVATISRDDITECFANTWPDGPEKMCDCAYELYEMGA